MPAANGCFFIVAALDAQSVRWVVWGGLVALTISLLVLMRTRWGQSHPLRKCIVLSLVAHLLLGIYTTTVNIVTRGRGFGDGAPIRVALAAPGGPLEGGQGDHDAEPWDVMATLPIEELAAQVPSGSEPPALADTAPERTPTRATAGAALPGEITTAPAFTPGSAAAKASTAAAIDAPQATRTDPPAAAGPEHPAAAATEAASSDTPPTRSAPLEELVNPLEHIAAPPADGDGASTEPARTQHTRPAAIAATDPFEAPRTGSSGGYAGRLVPVTLPGIASPVAAGGADAAVGSGSPEVGPSTVARVDGGAPAHELPLIYELRVAPDRMRQAIGHGGTRDTEAAVAAALKWLAAHQSADGRWDGRRLEAGREAAIDGHERRGAGTRADTGITGLALLAFLASGNTHLKGDHSETVRHGLEFLLSIQAADGNLGGDATLYEKMYCHAMASFALSEAYAMSSDDRLQSAVRRAIGYSLNAQHRPSGGWRYQPGEAGDTSQLGWQFMSLKSAELAGIPMPGETREGMVRYLKSVSSGRHAGLASYRPGHKVTRTMTAEALVCRQFLGMARSNPASDEAGDFLLQELPGRREANFYYWYYGTLAMYQLQGEHWERWNEALQTTLVGSQRGDGDMAGSWDPDPIWGAYGGRAYSTALGALCLEVYYRYLPFYIEAGGRDRQPK